MTGSFGRVAVSPRCRMSALRATVVALEEHGFSVEVAGDLDAARQAVLARLHVVLVRRQVGY
jgi:hypothetical protein